MWDTNQTKSNEYGKKVCEGETGLAGEKEIKGTMESNQNALTYTQEIIRH